MENLTSFMSRLVFKSSNLDKQGLKDYYWFEILAILMFIGAAGGLVYATGGLKFVYSHLMYIPIILAGLRFGVLGGLLAGVLGGLVLGPYMPLVVETGEPQVTHAWVYRMLFMTLIGCLVGVFVRIESSGQDLLKQMVADLSKTCARILKSFSLAIAAKDTMTMGHCERVAYNAQVIGSFMEMEAKGISEVFWAGLLHDLGKIGVPDSILLKPGGLEPLEFEVIKKHAGFGDEMLRNISPAFDNIARGIRSHHERWDGKGYPDGLKGRRIPVIGRVLAVSDVYEALTVKRPYRDPMKPDQAAQYVRDGSGTLFDPKVVSAFDRAFQAGRICTAVDQDTILYDLPDEMGLDFIFRGYGWSKTNLSDDLLKTAIQPPGMGRKHRAPVGDRCSEDVSGGNGSKKASSPGDGARAHSHGGSRRDSTPV